MSEEPVYTVVSGKKLLEIVHALIKEEDTFYIAPDYYWSVPVEDTFNIEREPKAKQFTMGQVSDDWEELLEVLEGGDDPLLWHDLEHLCGLLRAIAYEAREK